MEEQNESRLFQTLNDPHKDCTTVDSYCVASLQQKVAEDVVGGNLRDVEAKVIPFQFGTSTGTHRPSHYLCEFNSNIN